MSDLYIYGGRQNRNADSREIDYIYHTNTGKLNGAGQVIDDLKRIHQIAAEKRDEYVDYIDSLNGKFLEENLIYDNTISVFFFTDLFNKRHDYFETYTTICHILYIKEKLSATPSVENIYLIGCNNIFAQSLKSILSEINIIEADTKTVTDTLFKAYLLQFSYFIKTLFQLLIFKSFEAKSNNTMYSGRLFLSRYPLCFDTKFRDGKYGDMVEETDRYLISIVTDGMHQNVGLWRTLASMFELQKRESAILLDRYVGYRDVIGAVATSCGYLRSLRRLIAHEYRFDGINIGNAIRVELIQSFMRVPRLFMYRNAILKVLSVTRVEEFFYYLHEYSYGRFFNYIFAKYYPLIARVGFQHGPASHRNLFWFISKTCVGIGNDNWREKTPMPTKVLAEDERAMSIYRKAGYSNLEKMERVFRFNHLDKVKRRHINSDEILIVPGLHDGQLLLDSIIQLIRSNPTKCYLFKPHPKSRLFENGLPESYNAANLKLVNGNIKDYFESASEVITSYGSAGVEAHLLGINVNIVYIPTRLSDSPLVDISETEGPHWVKHIW